MEAWDRENGRESVGAVVRAVCEQAARCEADAAPVDECVLLLGKKMAGSAQAKTLAVARPELVAGIADCVRKASCAEPHPVAACLERQDKESP